MSLVLGEGSTNNINNNIGAIEKSFCINFSKTIFFCGITLHYNHDNNYLLVNGKEIYKFKADNKNVSIAAQIRLRNKSDEYDAAQSREVF